MLCWGQKVFSSIFILSLSCTVASNNDFFSNPNIVARIDLGNTIMAILYLVTISL